MTRQRMVELLEIEKECVLRNACGECNRACHICDLLQDDTELHEMYEEVIALVKAQVLMPPVTSEVQYGEHLRHCPSCGKALPNSGEYGKSYYCYKCGQEMKWK